MSSLAVRRMLHKIAGVGKSPIQSGIRLLTTAAADLPTCPYPYLLLPLDVVRDSGKVTNLNFYDLERKKRVTVAEQKIPESIYFSRSIGSSRGWVIRMDNEDLTVHLTNMFHPSAPKSSHKVISLPPLLPLPRSLDPSETTPLTELVRNVSLSTSPDQEDCVVAIKFWGSCISLCRRLNGDSWSWTHINDLPSEYEFSSVIYSNADSIFYLTPSVDTVRKPDHSYWPDELYERDEFVGPKDKHGFPLVGYFMQLGSFKRPEKLSDSGKRFLVETPSGDIFTIMWYMETVKKPFFFCHNESDLYVVETKRFELYKHDMIEEVESYITNIGDLCIFFGKNEPFCVAASMYPGLKPNSIYFTETNQICVYDIATHSIQQLPHQEPLLTPFWLPPILV